MRVGHVALLAITVPTIRADSRFAPSQWDTSLQSHAVSQWLRTNLESALYYPGAQYLCQITDWFDDREHVDFICRCPIFKWLGSMRGRQDDNPSNDHKVTCPISTFLRGIRRFGYQINGSCGIIRTRLHTKMHIYNARFVVLWCGYIPIDSILIRSGYNSDKIRANEWHQSC